MKCLMKLHYDKKIQSSALSRFENHSHTEKPYLSKELLFLDHLETKYYRFFFHLPFSLDCYFDGKRYRELQYYERGVHATLEAVENRTL